MKIKLFAVALVAVIVGFSSCGGKKDKSSECDILTFKVGNAVYGVTGTSITYLYEKTAEQTWTNFTSWPAVPSITLSPKATIDPPATQGQDFSAASGVKYTVTAEDGTTKIYTVKATMGTL